MTSRWFQSPITLTLFAFLLHSTHGQLSAQEFASRCQNFDTQMFLADKMSEATITCALQVEATQITWTRESIGGSGVNITQMIGDGSAKYESTANRLMVKNLVAGDEGVYTCHYISVSGPAMEDADCVEILGTTQYVSCVSSESCVDTFEVTEGDDISFDVNFTFVNGGDSEQHQVVNLLQFYKGDNPSDFLVLCNINAGGCDVMGGRIQVVQRGSNIYNLNLTLPGAMTTDAGTYTARIEVVLPTTGGQEFVLKTFEVTVIPHSPVPTPTPPPVITSTVSTNVPTMMVSTSSDSSSTVPVITSTNVLNPTNVVTGSVGGTPSGNDNTVVIAVVVPLSIVLVALLVIAAVAFAAFIYKHNITTRSPDSTKPTQLLSMTSTSSSYLEKYHEDEKSNELNEVEKRLSVNENELSEAEKRLSVCNESVEFGNKERESTEDTV